MTTQAQALSLRLSRSVMAYYKPEAVRWHYEHGLVLQAVWATGKCYAMNELCAWVKSMYETQINADGVIKGYVKEDYTLDNINAGKMLFALYHETGDERYRTAFETLRKQLAEHPRTKSNGFWHKKGYPWQMWLDGLYMQAPFYAQYAAEYENGNDAADTSIGDIIGQFNLVYEKTVDSKTGLLYHAWDEACSQAWADKSTGRSPHVWARAMGWYAMALIDVLDFVPENFANYRDELLKLVRSFLKPVLNYQDASGLWWQIMDHQGEAGNYLESSATAMFAYFLLKSARLGYFTGADAAAARAAGLKALEGMEEKKLRTDEKGILHLYDTCGGAGLGKVPDSNGPYRDGTYHYYASEIVRADDFKGVGPLILAALEREEA